MYIYREREREKGNFAIVAIQIDLQGIMLSKISNTEKHFMITFTCEILKKNLTDTEKIHGYQKQGMEVG